MPLCVGTACVRKGGCKVKKTKLDRVSILVFLLPALALYLLFVMYPVISALQTSMYQWRGIGSKKWIGLDNYIKMFSDENFLNALGNTMKYILFQVPITVLVPLFIALLIANSKSRWTPFYRSTIFLPHILPGVAVAMLWATIFNPVSGLLNGLLRLVGLGSWATEWLGRTESAFGSVLWVTVWGAIGFYTVLLLAGVLNISRDLFEAAEIDGANKIQRSIYVIIPLLSGILKVVVTFTLINALKMFEMPQVLTGGGPNRSTEPVSLYIYEQAFKNYNFGYASAIGVVFFIIVLVITLATQRAMKGDAS